jgi:hypothetical protein
MARRVAVAAAPRVGLAIVLAVALLALAIAVGSAAADIYTFTDDEGVVHFTNLKPKRQGLEEADRRHAGARLARPSADRGGCARCDAVPAKDRSPERFRRYDPSTSSRPRRCTACQCRSCAR